MQQISQLLIIMPLIPCNTNKNIFQIYIQTHIPGFSYRFVNSKCEIYIWNNFHRININPCKNVQNVYISDVNVDSK